MQITHALLRWYDQSRRSLAFRGTRDPYRVWLSEIMLQQTRAQTVEGYYTRFLAQFPDVFALSRAQEQEVLKAWEGLGYYSRARNLHRAARLVVDVFGGQFPSTAEALRQLPGVGPYTAAAVVPSPLMSHVPAIDGNLIRVLSRLYLVEDVLGIPSVKRHLYELGRALMPEPRAGDMGPHGPGRYHLPARHAGLCRLPADPILYGLSGWGARALARAAAQKAAAGGARGGGAAAVWG